MPTNNFLPFAIGSGANVESQSAYAADALLPIGNQPGVAVSAFNNKAIRQSSVISSQIAQFVANTTGTDVLDDTNTTKLLAQIFSAFGRKAPVVTALLSGSGVLYPSYKIQVASANATAAATYSDGTTTFTVSATISAGLELVVTGPAAPAASGTLTKVSGTGDATIIYYAVRAPISMSVQMVGGGGGGAGNGSIGTSGAGGAGGDTTFGTSLLVAHGGLGGGIDAGNPGAGGAASLGTGPVGIALTGSAGGAGGFTSTAIFELGGAGGASPFGGAGNSPRSNTAGGAAAANTGSGGSGASSTGGGDSAGSAGGAGGFLSAVINAPLAASYPWTCGAGGSAGTAGGGGHAGGAGGSGLILIELSY